MRNSCLTTTVLPLLIACLSSQILRAAPAPTSAPAPAATTRPQDMEPLGDGSIRYTPPGAGWKRVDKSDNARKASYVTEDGFGRIDINVDPQTRDVPDSYAQQMAMIIGKGIREQAKTGNRQLILQPRVEKDDRFFLAIHDRMRGAPDATVGTADERINDRYQLYRVMGLNIVHVAVSAFVTDEQEAPPIHDAGKNLLAGMRITRGVAPVVFPKANLKITPPVDWKATKADQPNGLVATYTPPADPSAAPAAQIIVRARIIPKDAQADPVKRDNLLDRMTDEERRTAPFTSAARPGDEQQLGDPKYLRQIATTVQPGGTIGASALKVTTRYLVVGDVLVSVRSVADEADESTAKLADALAASMKPIK